MNEGVEVTSRVSGIWRFPLYIAFVLLLILCLLLVFLVIQNRANLKVLEEIKANEVKVLSEVSNLEKDRAIDKDSDSVSIVKPSRHQAVLSALDVEAGVPVSELAVLITRDEGFKVRPYLDTGGAPTVGVGRNLRGNGLSVSELRAIAGEVDTDLLLREAHVQNGRVRIHSISLANRVFVKPLTRADVELLLTDDLKNTRHDAVSVFGEKLWGEISEARQMAIIDVLFNLGLKRFRTFHKFIGAVKAKDWKTASMELLLSDAARQNILRYHRASVVIDTNDRSHFQLK